MKAVARRQGASDPQIESGAELFSGYNASRRANLAPLLLLAHSRSTTPQSALSDIHPRVPIHRHYQ